jgi:natural product precursor
MKTMKLNALENQSLNNKEMSKILGGRSCSCSCAGPSGVADNLDANYNIGSSGGHSTSGDNCYHQNDNLCWVDCQ